MAKALKTTTRSNGAAFFEHRDLFLLPFPFDGDKSINDADRYIMQSRILADCKSERSRPTVQANLKDAAKALSLAQPKTAAGIHAIALAATRLQDDGFGPEYVNLVLSNIADAAQQLHNETGNREAAMRPVYDAINEPMRRLERALAALDTFALAAIESVDTGDVEGLAQSLMFFAETLTEHFEKADALLNAAVEAGLSPGQKARAAESQRRLNMANAEALGEQVTALLEGART